MAYQLIILLAKIKMNFLYQSVVVIGITGSYGKTATKEILNHILSIKYQVCSTPGTKNTLIGVALTILKDLNKNHQFFIVEMGAYKQGEIKKICQLVKPKVGIITGITKQHLSLFKSLESIINGKYELIDSLPKNSLAVFNSHNPITLKLARQTSKLIVKTYTYPKKNYQTNLVGHHQQLNISAVILVAKHFKIPMNLINKQLKNIPPFNSAITLVQGYRQAVVINDIHNSNPEGFKQIIRLAKSKNFNNKILITSGIIDLGKDSKIIHRQLIKKAEKVFTKIFLTSTTLNYLSSDITHQDSYQKILKIIKSQLNSKTLVVLEGRLPKKFTESLWQNQS